MICGFTDTKTLESCSGHFCDSSSSLLKDSTKKIRCEQAPYTCISLQTCKHKHSTLLPFGVFTNQSSTTVFYSTLGRMDFSLSVLSCHIDLCISLHICVFITCHPSQRGRTLAVVSECQSAVPGRRWGWGRMGGNWG